jgi:hypothetical protein
MNTSRVIFKSWLDRSMSYASAAAASIAIVCAVVACGGGSGGTTLLSSPGTGGTGITATGPVAGFGSVIVNGTRFDDSNARVNIDGDIVTQSQLRLGMVANVVGVKSTGSFTTTAIVNAAGTANSIDVWSVAQGSVTAIISPNKFNVAGMTMLTDAGTVLEGVMSVSNLNTQTVVKIWAQPANSSFTEWSVTRLEILSKLSDTISTGKVVINGTTPTLNGLVLANAASTNLKDGQFIRAVGTLSSSPTASTLSVSKISLLGTAAHTGYAEIQGVVTSVLATNTATTPAKVTRLLLGSIEVDTSNATLSPAGASLAQGTRIEVEGTWNGSVLVAAKVEAKSESQIQEVEMEGTIDQFTSLANFIVRGQRCDASGLTKVGNGTLASIALGKRVGLHGIKKGDVVVVTELEIK